jgi:phage host-nuclease inhibitor protein Gam
MASRAKAKSKRKKTSALSVAVPQTREQATKVLADYGTSLRLIEAIETVMNGELARIKQEAMAKAEPVLAMSDALFKGLQTYCEANRTALTDGGKSKTIDLGTGKVSWRHNPAKVNLRGKVEDIIQRIRNAGDEFKGFLRATVEIDRVAMLRDPKQAEKIDGVKIASAGEMFTADPFGSEELPEAEQ